MDPRMRYFLLILLLFSGCSRKPGNDNNSNDNANITWPKLQEFAATTGRPASEEDVKLGAAVFVLKDGEQPIGKPINIPLPQYAFHVNQESGRRTPCVIIQAEEARDQKFVGAIQLPNKEPLVAFLFEFELLGTENQR